MTWKTWATTLGILAAAAWYWGGGVMNDREKAAASAAADAAKVRDSAFKAEVARAEAEREVAQKKKAAASAAAFKDALRQKYAAFTFAGRQDAIKGICAPKCQEDELAALIDGAPSGERQRLRDLAATTEIAAMADVRKRFAATYDEFLLSQKLNPDGVAADGPSRTTMHVRGWFCTRQFMHDFTNSETSKAAVDIGFKKIVCESSVEIFTWEL